MRQFSHTVRWCIALAATHSFESCSALLPSLPHATLRSQAEQVRKASVFSTVFSAAFVYVFRRVSRLHFSPLVRTPTPLCSTLRRRLNPISRIHERSSVVLSSFLSCATFRYLNFQRIILRSFPSLREVAISIMPCAAFLASRTESGISGKAPNLSFGNSFTFTDFFFKE